jgi:hypothetical protein
MTYHSFENSRQLFVFLSAGFAAFTACETAAFPTARGASASLSHLTAWTPHLTAWNFYLSIRASYFHTPTAFASSLSCLPLKFSVVDSPERSITSGSTLNSLPT